jgi:hypothetical protein
MNIRNYILCFITSLLLFSCQKEIERNTTPQSPYTVKLTFRNEVDGAPMNFTTTWVNGQGEDYTISAFKYYISNIELIKPSGDVYKDNGYYLIDQSVPGSLSITLHPPDSTYTSIVFLSGVDSARNVSGAQTGALDPIKGMFWTWNSGYIMAKMEGNSPASAQPNNQFEYHIGGFAGANSALRSIGFNLSLQPLRLRANGQSEIILFANANDWFDLPNPIDIATTPVCTTPGVLASQIADNYARMFGLVGVVNN